MNSTTNLKDFIKELGTIELIPFFIESLNKHTYINAKSLSKFFLKEKFSIPYNDPSFKQYIRSLTHKFNCLIRESVRIGIIAIYNPKFFKVIDKKNLSNIILMKSFPLSEQSTLKDQVFNYMKMVPDCSIEDLYRKFPKNKKKTLINYKCQYLKNIPNSNKNTLRSQVFSYIKANPNCLIEDLLKRFPNNKRHTISRYKYQYLKKNNLNSNKTSLYGQVFDYLELNPNSSLKDLLNQFSNKSKNTLCVYKSLYLKNKSS